MISNPVDVFSQNGTLSLNLDLRSEVGPTGFTHYCYVYMVGNQAVEAPTLRVNPGDQLVINFTNHISAVGMAPKSRHAPMQPMEMGDMKMAATQGDPCLGGMITASSTNIHFHGMNIPPVCHQDEVVKTVIPNNGVPFPVFVQSARQRSARLVLVSPARARVLGTTGIWRRCWSAHYWRSQSADAGASERVITIRRNVDAVTDDDGQFSINFENANSPRSASPVIKMQSGQRGNSGASSMLGPNGFLALQILSPGPQQIQVIGLDGIPTTPFFTNTLYIPPAGRAEIIVPALTSTATSQLTTLGFDTGPIGDVMTPAQLAQLVVAPSVNGNVQVTKSAPESNVVPRFSGLASMAPTTTRALFFSEVNVGTNGPGQFFVTLNGQTPKLFDPKNPPAVVTKVGAVEDWTIENRTGEAHAFHIHQIHFLVTAINGQAVANPQLMDTVTVPSWTGTGPYPNVTMRMDFRDPNIAGSFLYHCHILDHEDGGMMATIVVNP